jgi:hypothetical protein
MCVGTEAAMGCDIGGAMRKYKKILRLMIFSHVITLNNFLQVWLLSGKDAFSFAVGVAVLMAMINFDHIFGIVELGFSIVPIIAGFNLAAIVICFIKLRPVLYGNGRQDRGNGYIDY